MLRRSRARPADRFFGDARAERGHDGACALGVDAQRAYEPRVEGEAGEHACVQADRGSPRGRDAGEIGARQIAFVERDAVAARGAKTDPREATAVERDAHELGAVEERVVEDASIEDDAL